MSLSACTGHGGRTRRARARVRVQIWRIRATDESHRNRFARAQCFAERTSLLRIQISLPHHRALHAGAVLSVVNALRFASTRPVAGPSGIDDVSARHDLGYCAMAGFLMAQASREKRVDARFRQAYLDVSRLCPTAHPPHRTQCVQSAFLVVALRARFKRTPQHRVRLLRSHAAREPAHT